MIVPVDFDTELRERLDRLAAAVPVDAEGRIERVMGAPVRSGATARRLAFGSLLPVVAMALVGTMLAALAGVGPFAPGATDANGPVVATVTDGQFELTLRSAKARYAAGEPISIDAALAYGGDGEVTIGHAYGAHRTPIGFRILEPVLGDLSIGTGWDLACDHSTLAAGSPIEAAFQKGGSWTSDDPRADEYQAFMIDPVLRLTPGTWHVYAEAWFLEGDCGGQEHRMLAEIAIEVIAGPSVSTVPPSHPSGSREPAASATIAPSSPGTSPGPLTGVGGVEARATDGSFEVRIASPKASWFAGTPIDVEVDVAYVGTADAVEVGSASPFMTYSVTQLDGVHATGSTAEDVCTHTSFERGVPRKVDFHKGGGYSPTTPDYEWLKAYADDNSFRLTPGTWEIAANLDVSVPSCDGERHGLDATIVIEVVDAVATGGPAAGGPNASISQIEWAAGIVRSYAAEHPDSFAALWIDRSFGHPVRVASSWTEDIEAHRAELQERIGAVVPFALFAAEYTEAELVWARDRILRDREWLATVSARLLGLGAGGTNNRVELEVSSALPDAPERIRTHFAEEHGFDAGMLVVSSDGTGAAFVPWGTVRVTLELPAEPMPDDVELSPGWTSDVRGLQCGSGLDVGVGFEAIPCQEGRWTIQVQAWRNGTYSILGSGVVDVVAGETVDLTIEVQPYNEG